MEKRSRKKGGRMREGGREPEYTGCEALRPELGGRPPAVSGISETNEGPPVLIMGLSVLVVVDTLPRPDWPRPAFLASHKPFTPNITPSPHSKPQHLLRSSLLTSLIDSSS
ncbi:hypothetical protein Pmani_032205 [Petrolisthes manimaculis]|uniref:Uncharacterized protein n=1 Tax=Petrolisthes manimaculis TaxID=1843537 RepID=A0AAE1NTI8_9EUCA|nr:hypothetical protein Pmani_032205 [Petrolisthes manimaculis]